MRQYTLDGIELALKAIEHRKDCKTAAGIIRKMIVTERLHKFKCKKFKIDKSFEKEWNEARNGKYRFFNEKDNSWSAICDEESKRFISDTNDMIFKHKKQTWFNKLLKKVGL